MKQLTKDELQYIEENSQEAYELLLTLGKIPAPSNQEEQRAEFCKSWLLKQGAQGVSIDCAGNVVYPVGCTKNNPVIVIMAHMDVVFPDTQPLPMVIENGKIKAPGIGDDTANLCALLMCARYIAQKKIVPQNRGILLVADAGEEGLGSLKGSRQIVKDYGDRIEAFYSFDLYMDSLITDAVGCKRYQVEVLTEGGHSFYDFGNQNAIACLASLIKALYSINVPVTKTKTTCNVGTISGGTSVNTIAQQAEMLYEFRSDSKEDLAYMDKQFQTVIENFRSKEIQIQTTLVGERPCTGEIDQEKQKALADHVSAIMEKHTGRKPHKGSGSTDCNIPLSAGIPAVCLGVVKGGQAHTRQEWIEIASLKTGYKIAFEVILSCF